MNLSQSRKSVRWLPLWVALGLALASLGLVALFALAVPHEGIPASQPPFGNLQGVARSYLFRKTLTNTLFILAIVGSTVFAIAFAVMPRLGLMPRRRTWLYALALAPLLLPVPIAAFLWEPLFTWIDIVFHPRLALCAIAFVQVWRLWPLCILAAPLMVGAGRRRTAVATALAASWLALLDTGTPLLSTGGEPFNETQVWASWSFQTLWVSRLWAYGAVMVVGLAAASAVIGALIWHILAARNRPTPVTRPEWHAPDAATLAAGAGVALLPVVIVLPAIFEHGIMELMAQLMRSGYWRWAANTLAVVTVAAAIATLVVMPARAAGAAKRPNLLAFIFMIGLAVAPVQFWLAVRWFATAHPGLGLLVAALAAGLSSGLIALWPASAGQGDRGRRVQINAAATVTLAAAIIALNQFALGIVLANSRAGYTLGTGPALRLAGTSSLSPLPEMASLLTFVLASTAAYGLLRWLRH